MYVNIIQGPKSSIWSFSLLSLIIRLWNINGQWQIMDNDSGWPQMILGNDGQPQMIAGDASQIWAVTDDPEPLCMWLQIIPGDVGWPQMNPCNHRQTMMGNCQYSMAMVKSHSCSLMSVGNPKWYIIYDCQPKMILVMVAWIATADPQW